MSTITSTSLPVTATAPGLATDTTPTSATTPQTMSFEELRLMYDALLAENTALKATITTTTATLTAALSPVNLSADTPPRLSSDNWSHPA